MGDVLHFPSSFEGTSALRLPCPPPELPALQKFDPGLTSDLYHLASGVHERSVDLIKFIDSDRLLAREAGIETIAIELSAILEGDGLRRMIGTLRDAASRGQSSEITFDGLERLRRAEKLLTDAAASVESFTRLKPLAKSESYLGQEVSKPTGGDHLIWIPIVVIGVIGIVGIISTITKGPSERS